MEIVQDKTNLRLFLIYPPGKPSFQTQAKYLLHIPKSGSISTAELFKLATLSAQLKKDLLLPAKNTPPFHFLNLRKISP